MKVDLTVPQMRALLSAGTEILAGETGDWSGRDIQALERGLAVLRSAIEVGVRDAMARRRNTS